MLFEAEEVGQRASLCVLATELLFDITTADQWTCEAGFWAAVFTWATAQFQCI